MTMMLSEFIAPYGLRFLHPLVTEHGRQIEQRLSGCK